MTARKRVSKSNTARNASLVSAAGVAAIAGAAWYFRKELMSLLGFDRVEMADHIRARVPVAKDLKTIPDQDANYDMDGVSFDSEGVIVGSDKHFESPTEKQVHH